MARGGQRKADGPSRKGVKSQFKTLRENELTEIPPMPDADDWVSLTALLGKKRTDKDQRTVDEFEAALQEEEGPAQWAGPVVDWWQDIWSSPMAGEFVDSDVHGLYLACYYFHESLNPFYKASDRIAFAKQFENSIKNYGLTPSARESLRWQVAQGAAAQNRTQQIRAGLSQGSYDDSVGSSMDSLYGEYGM